MWAEESSFNEWIKQRRHALDLTQEDLADCVGCSRAAIQKIEQGERRPSKQVAQRLAECLKIAAEEHEAFVRFARGEGRATQSSIGSAARSAVGPPAPIPNNLPTPLTPLIGRKDALDAAHNYLMRQDIRLLTLTGEPGIGKTRLSLGLAAQMLPEFKDGVFFVELASTSEPDLVASTIAITLGFKEAGSDSLIEGLKRFLKAEVILLVLDNFEQVLDAAPLVIDLLRACPALKVLVTSREALHIAGEQQFPVPPLEVPDLTRLPDGQDEQDLLRYPSIELFVQRASAVEPGFALTGENYRIVAAICTRLEGIPLAIELAAARIKMFTPQDLLSHLDEQLKLLTGGPRHLPARMQTLREAIDWSYRLLSPAEQGLFVCFGVFMGGTTLSAIQAVYAAQEGLPEVLEGVGSLVDKNLVRRERGNERSISIVDKRRPGTDAARRQRERGESRFAMLEMVREYAWEKLMETEGAEATKRAHALFFLELAEEANAKVWGPEELSWLNRMEEEHGNLRAALQWCITEERDNSSVEMGLRLVVALGRFWEIRGYLSEGRERIASVLSRPGTREPQVRGLRAWALVQGAALAFWQSDYSAVHPALEEALAIFRELEDKTGIARTLTDLGDVAREEGDYDTSALLCEQALSICRELGDKHGTVLSLVLLGWAEMRPGYYPQATEHLEEGLALARQLQIQNRVALALSALGEVMVRQGMHEKAIGLLEESLTIRRATGYRWGTAATLGTLGWAALRRGDLKRASEMLMESLMLRKELGDKGGVTWCLEKFVEIEAAEGHPLRAAHMLGAARALRQNIRTSVDIADQTDAERTVNTVRRQLGTEAFGNACAQGEAMTFEQIVEYAQAARGKPVAQGALT